QRLDLGQKRAPALVGLEPGAPLLALGVGVVAPERRVGGERADIGRERADEAAQVLLLNRDPLRLVQTDELGQLARVDVVVALLDDHATASLREPVVRMRVSSTAE